MDSIQAFLLAVGWGLVRFGIPVLLTVGICKLFKGIDARWISEGETYKEKMGLKSLGPAVRCWVFNDCEEFQKINCPAYQNQDVPCWQHFRSGNGELRQGCLGCGVFKSAPIPISGD